MELDRVKFFSRNDFCYGLGLQKIETLEIPAISDISVNDAIEYYEIKRYFDNGVRSKEWSDTQYNNYTNKSKQLFGLSFRFFEALNDENILSQYLLVDNTYHESFWDLFNICKLYNVISEDVFRMLINSDNTCPSDLFLFKRIVEKYDVVLREFLLQNMDNIRIVLSVYEQDYIDGEKKKYLPEALTGQDICSYLEAFVNSEHPNLNQLNAIVNMRCTQRFPITDEIRLMAKRRYEKELDEKTFTTIENEIKLTFTPDQKEEKNVVNEGGNFSFSYSTNWLKDTLDYPSILNNFIYIFEFADCPQMRCQLVSLESHAGIFERAFLPKSKRIYPANAAFHTVNNLSLMQMKAYYSFLQNNGVFFESVLAWFYTVYLQEEFGCAQMRVSFPGATLKYSEKCSIICEAFDSVLKQFSLYVKHGEIDFELLQMSSGSQKYGDIPSLIDGKYVYGNGNGFANYRYCLFSDQCMLSFVKRIYNANHSYKCFYELISKEIVFLTDYRIEYQNMIRELEKEGFVSVDSNGIIMPNNKIKIKLIKDINDNEVISRWHYPQSAQSIIQEWLERGLLRVKNGLLSEPEVSYFNYLLNQVEFSNGLDIRNKYSHGIQQTIIDENNHEENYLILLKVFVIATIKINDDFCLKQMQQAANKLGDNDA